MNIVKKEVLKSLSVRHRAVSGGVNVIYSGGVVVFPFQKMVKLVKINRSVVPVVLSASGAAVVQQNNSFLILDVLGNPVQNADSPSLPSGLVNTNFVVGIDDADSEIVFNPPVLCGGVNVLPYLIQGSAALTGSESDYYFTFEIIEEVFEEVY